MAERFGILQQPGQAVEEPPPIIIVKEYLLPFISPDDYVLQHTW